MFQRLPIKFPTANYPPTNTAGFVGFLFHQMQIPEFVNLKNVWISMKRTLEMRNK